jgi:putative hydrolase of the HAD superfamily
VQGGDQSSGAMKLSHKGVEKPDVAIFELAMETMNCKAENSVMIGNNFNDDVLGAINAGMSAVFLTPELKESDQIIIKEKSLELDIISDIGQIKDIM